MITVIFGCFFVEVCGGSIDAMLMMPSESPSQSIQRTEHCVDFEDWTSASDRVCRDFAKNDLCKVYGDIDLDDNGIMANEACCYCGGGTKAAISTNNMQTPFPTTVPNTASNLGSPSLQVSSPAISMHQTYPCKTEQPTILSAYPSELSNTIADIDSPTSPSCKEGGLVDKLIWFKALSVSILLFI